jgi:hypothetical protein
MSIEETEDKLSNMHFNSIVKSYCNKVNDNAKLKAEIKQLKKELRETQKLLVSACDQLKVEDRSEIR